MSEATPSTPATPDVPPSGSAGAMLRTARERRGLELDQLALLLKVPVRKLEALEADRHEELPGMAFVRGLATSIARQLEIDPQPVLAALPSVGVAPVALESVTRGLATPYHEPMGGHRLTQWRHWLRPNLLAPIALLLLALLVWQAPPAASWLPEGLVAAWTGLKGRLSGSASPDGTTVIEAPVAVDAAASSGMASADGGDSGGAVAVSGAPSAVIETVHSAPREDLQPVPVAAPASASGKAGAKATAPAAAASEPARAAYARTVVLRTRAESWIEARDAAGAILLSRMLPAGETVGLEGSLPIRLKIGNAEGTEVLFKGAPVDLAPLTRENVARVELN
ncbi:helix-turn-helix domain-containing protein [Leptothrix discophora]|uniref:Helix-turn-helix domain-containing protein n=1 Tax=Leptothrix discophora TaxID=89 RepID=A0ABT9G131_LEPDI|nr:helix-turn-helix domain-containing protein [Leptothrix discophora]MDP4300135.1 helix-turn-helix domain-containing protein [Leptothrix discophora]